jgi:hypothetical protein
MPGGQQVGRGATATAAAPQKMTKRLRDEALAKCFQGIEFLAGQCNWAQTWDGAGFAKNDTGIGHELAATPPAEWDDEMLGWAYSRCVKYREQLKRAFGLDFVATIPAIEEIVVEGERWWERRRREKAEREAASRPKPQWQIDKEARDAEYAALREQRRLRDEAELVKPRKVTLLGGGRVRFDYPFVWGSDVTNAAMAEIKALPSRQFNGTKEADKHWEAPIVEANVAPLLALARQGWTLGEGVEAALKAVGKQERQRATAEARNRVESKAEDAEIALTGLLREPYPFQKAGIKFAVRERRVLIADQPGLGKTLQALGTLEQRKAYPAVVVCPASVKYNWAREVEKTIARKLNVVVLEGAKPAPLPVYRNADVIIVNYDILAKHVIMLTTETKPKAVIFDESHYLKNKQASRTKNAKALTLRADTGKPVDDILCLTGTPILNRPVELLSQLDILGRTGDVARDPLGKARPDWYFLTRYCAAYQDRFGWHFDGADNLTELHERLTSTCMIRREKTNVLKDLPPKQRVVIEIDLDNRAEYDRAERDLVNYLAGSAVEDKKFRASLAGLSKEEQAEKVREHYESQAVKTRRAEQLVRFNALKQLAAKGKMKQIKEWAAGFLESGQKLVMMGWHRETVLALAREFDAPTVMGGDAGRKRDENVQAFQRPDGPKVIACNIIAAGEGITLTASSNTLFAELGWNPGKMEQAEDRIHRISQEASSVTCWYLLAKNSIDTMLWEIIEQKKHVVAAATDGVEYTDEGGSVLDALVQSMLDKMPAPVQKGKKAA